MLNCFEIAHADVCVTRKMISTTALSVMPMVEALSDLEYKEMRSLDPKLKQYKKLLTDCYQSAVNNGFSFEPDQYGGFGLFYRGQQEIMKKSGKSTFLTSVLGYIEKIPESSVKDLKEILMFRATEVCKKDRIMVGTTRFANHSCRPNCRYVVSEVGARKCIKLEILKDITTGDEITVFYSSNDFFGEGNRDCLCPHVDLHRQIEDKKQQCLEPNKRIILHNSWKSYVFQRRRRFFISKRRQRKIPRTIEMRNFPEASDRSKSNDSNESCLSTKNVSDSEPMSEESSSSAENFISSPQEHFCLPECDLSSINTTFEKGDSSYNGSSSEEESDKEPKNPQDENFRLNFSLCVNEIISRSGTSDAEANKWIKLLRAACPEKRFPSYKSIKKESAISETREHL